MKAASQKRSLDMLHGTLWDKIPRFAAPAAAPALCACRRGGLWGAAGSRGALRLLPGVTLGLVRIKGEWFTGK